MENTKDSCGGEKPIQQNPNPDPEKPIQENPNPDPDVKTESNPSSNQPSRTPFTSLSQLDADLALARTLQGQERAYMMLRMNDGDGGDYESSDGGDYDSSDGGSFVYEDEEVDPDDVENGESDGGEDAFDVHERADGEEEHGARAHFGRETFDSDEAYARALQDAEEREVAVHLMALAAFHDWEGEDPEDYDSNSQDTWQEVDPDELSYEELLALGEVVGTESRGLSTDIIASLPSINYKAHSALAGNSDQCVICRLDYEDGDALIVLKCKHAYHSECVNNWLQINKVCPICSAEVSASEEREGTSENAQG